jgi:hypothetical protein
MIGRQPTTRLVRTVSRATVMLASGLLSCLAMAVVITTERPRPPGGRCSVPRWAQ